MINPNLKAKDRIHDNLPEDLKKLMRDHLLSDEDHMKVLKDIKDKSYKGKSAVEHPKYVIVLGQTGAGKSNLTTSLISSDDNIVVIDTDKYKGYREDSSKIQEEYLVEYAYLTAPDAYLHRDEMIYDAMSKKYNILMECATSEKEGMFVNLDRIREKGYEVEIAVLGVSSINSLLSIHERYESQIDLNLSSAKLTSIRRHDDSYTSLRKCVKTINENEINVSVFKRGVEFPYKPQKIYTSKDEIKRYASAIDALDFAQLQDKRNTMFNFNQRYAIVQQQMLRRNAPIQQLNQLNEVLNRFNEEKEKEEVIEK